MRIDELENLIRSAGARPRLVYTVPIHHNPTSACLSEQRRIRLLALAVEFDFIVVSDEPYTFINFDTSDEADDASTSKLQSRTAPVSLSIVTSDATGQHTALPFEYSRVRR